MVCGECRVISMRGASVTIGRVTWVDVAILIRVFLEGK